MLFAKWPKVWPPPRPLVARPAHAAAAALGAHLQPPEERGAPFLLKASLVLNFTKLNLKITSGVLGAVTSCAGSRPTRGEIARLGRKQEGAGGREAPQRPLRILGFLTARQVSCFSPAPHPASVAKFPEDAQHPYSGHGARCSPTPAQPTARAPRLPVEQGAAGPAKARRGRPQLTQQGLQEDFSPQRAHGCDGQRRFPGTPRGPLRRAQPAPRQPPRPPRLVCAPRSQARVEPRPGRLHPPHPAQRARPTLPGRPPPPRAPLVPAPPPPRMHSQRPCTPRTPPSGKTQVARRSAPQPREWSATQQGGSKCNFGPLLPWFAWREG